MLEIFPINALSDNYIWAIINPQKRLAIVVDPGDARPVITELTEKNLNLEAIFITHHHYDHTGGIQGLIDHYGNQIRIYGPKNDNIANLTDFLVDGDIIKIKAFGEFKVLEIPGHTKGHIAILGNKIVFTGDTLFTGGCGKLFEGTPEQMVTSLEKLTKLDDKTLVYCGHEYTLKNLEFALKVEPDNPILKNRLTETKRLLRIGKPTVPASIGTEISTNPFLRLKEPTIIKSIEEHSGSKYNDKIAIFAALRNWKNTF